MVDNKMPIIHIFSIPEKTDRFVASYHAKFLDATYALEFSESLIGALALHRFARMIESQYNKAVSFQISEELFPFFSKAVSDIISSVGLSNTKKQGDGVAWQVPRFHTA